MKSHLFKLPICFVLTSPSGVAHAHLPEWLAQVFGASPEELPSSESPASYRLALGIMLVVRYLLQAIKVPVFQAGRVLSVLPLGSDAPVVAVCIVNIVNAELPLLDQIHPDCYRLAVSCAAAWLPRLAQQPVSRGAVAQLHAAIEREILAPLKSRVPGGKSSFQVMRVAHQMQIPFMHLGGGVYQLGWGQHLQLIDRSATVADAAIGARVAQDKAVSALFLRRAGLPAGAHQLVRNPDDALAAAQRLGWPVVVKPADRDRGEGVSVQVLDAAALHKAFALAQQCSKSGRILVEKQVEGVCHRLFIAHCQLLYAVKRWPRSVFGDGVHTVAALVDQAQALQNERAPWLREPPYPRDDLTLRALQQQGLGWASVPAAGQRVHLRDIESTQWGGWDEEVTHQLHPDNLTMALQTAHLLGLSVAGVDVISSDITQPWHQNGAIINEVNHAPLLGGGEISRKYTPQFLRGLMHGDGRIPVEVFVGKQSALNLAQARLTELAKAQDGIYLTSHECTWRASAAHLTPQPVVFSFEGLVSRVQALLMNRSVRVLLMVVQTDELLSTGLPVDRIAALRNAGDFLARTDGQDDADTRQAVEQNLMTMLRSALVH
jgi:cyanophycin synthetase